MALRASRSAVSVSRQTAGARPCVALPARRPLSVRAQIKADLAEASTANVGKAVALSAAVTTLLSSGNALAASELAQVAAGDGRLSTILLLFVPPVAWALFNAAGAINGQLDKMSDFQDRADPSIRVERGIAGALGLGAAGLLAAPGAEAATELAQLAASDGRFSTIALLFVPPVAWALFNAAGAINGQLDKMSDFQDRADPSIRVKRGIAGALGLGAAGLLAAPGAEAATELAQLAAGDSRFSTIALLFVPPVAWALFNAFGAINAQLDKMSDFKDTADPSIRNKRSIAGALGLGAAGLLAAPGAEAATELAQVAASDGRLGTILLLFVPPVGWALFNAAGAINGQLDKMSDFQDRANPSVRVKRGIAGALGLGAAGLLAAPGAEAATELAQLAATDSRFSTIALLFLPPVAWALFNAFGAINAQLDKMSDFKDSADPSIRKKK